MTDKNKLALDLYDVGAVKTKEQSPGGLGFKLKHHEKNPDAPLSPFFMNLRTAANPKPGPLTPEIVDAIGEMLFAFAEEQGIKYDCIVGVPNAGDPFADAFAKAAAAKGKTVQVLRMAKTTGVETRSVTSLTTPVATGLRVLIIDDLITKAGSKVEAIEVLRATGLEVKGVVVLVDREQGGVAQLWNETDVICHSVFLIRELLEIYLEAGRLTEPQHEEIFRYLFVK